jgi:hypothetical protein
VRHGGVDVAAIALTAVKSRARKTPVVAATVSRSASYAEPSRV